MSEGTRDMIQATGAPFDGDTVAFLAAAHELKSPLALIRQLSLALGAQELDAADCEQLVRQIRLTSERALRLTNDITRSARSLPLFDLEPLNPVSICEEVAHELSYLYAAHDKQIQVKARSHPPLLVGNRDLLRRILLNFGDNALHYAPSSQPAEFIITQAGDYVRIGLRDFGPAIEATLWQGLMERLRSQAPQPVSARPQSSGLGLYVASRFAEMMNSTIGAKRHRDGATFYIDVLRSRQLALL